MTEPKPIRNFVLVYRNGGESGSYHGRNPRQAAKKAIRSAGSSDILHPIQIRLRERGTKKLHIFSGYVSLEKVPEKHPAWMKDGAMMRVAHIKKVGIEKVK